MIHAENFECIAWLTERLEAAGKTEPRYHADSRPMAVEREATHRAIALSEIASAPLLIVHVSGREAVEEIRRARARGINILAETCPQYLFLSDRRSRPAGFRGREVHVQPAAARPDEPGA